MKKTHAALVGVVAIAIACSSAPSNVLRDAGEMLLDASDSLDGDAAAQETVTMTLTGDCRTNGESIATFVDWEVDGLVAADARVVSDKLCGNSQTADDAPAQQPPELYGNDCRANNPVLIFDGRVAVRCELYSRAEVVIEF